MVHQKSFEYFDSNDDTTFGYLALAASQPRPIGTGSFAANFAESRHRPRSVVGFVTPKHTLPTIRGRKWPVELKGDRAFEAFSSLTPWHSHGIMWLW